MGAGYRPLGFALINGASSHLAPGLYAVGLRFQRTRISHQIAGVGADASHIADLILARDEQPALEAAA